ncbi:hypothetical protein D9M68_828750 [compost metagenome]
MLAQWPIVGERLTKAHLTLGKADHQGREKLRLRFVHQTRRVIGMPGAQGGATQAIEDHHRTGNPCLAQLIQSTQAGLEGLALVDPREHLVVTRLTAHIGHAQTGIGQLLQLIDRLLAQVARQAIAGDPLDVRHVPANGGEDIQQASRRQHQGITVGEKHPLDE